MSTRPRLAFYAPLKPPTHGNPSGDRLIARRLMHTLQLTGFEVELASRFRSYDPLGDTARQHRLKTLGTRLAERLIRRYRRLPESRRPGIWFTYHLYHKAPDWIGPKVCAALSIPYVVAEASYAAKQTQGPWAEGLAATARALQRAELVLSLNPEDREGVRQIAPATRMIHLAPYLDLAPYTAQAESSREELAGRYGLNAKRTWLISVAMMRPGDKTASYRLLAESLHLCRQTDRELILVGGGRAEAEVRQAFAGLERVHFVGRLEREALIPLLKAADLMVWPAVNEAFGMALLEAQAAGTWVLAGDEGGVSSIVVNGKSGQLVPARNPAAMAEAIDALVAEPDRLRRLGAHAQRWCRTHHDETQAVDTLRDALLPLLTPGSGA